MKTIKVFPITGPSIEITGADLEVELQQTEQKAFYIVSEGNRTVGMFETRKVCGYCEVTPEPAAEQESI